VLLRWMMFHHRYGQHFRVRSTQNNERSGRSSWPGRGGGAVARRERPGCYLRLIASCSVFHRAPIMVLSMVS